MGGHGRFLFGLALRRTMMIGGADSVSRAVTAPALTFGPEFEDLRERSAPVGVVPCR